MKRARGSGGPRRDVGLVRSWLAARGSRSQPGTGQRPIADHWRLVDAALIVKTAQHETGATLARVTLFQVRSRRDLVGKVFIAHYEPRLRENEQRVIQGQPVRGGPLPASRT